MKVLICCVFAVISCASAGLLGGGGGGGDHHGHAGYSDSAYNHGGGYATQPAPVEENVIQVVEEQGGHSGGFDGEFGGEFGGGFDGGFDGGFGGGFSSGQQADSGFAPVPIGVQIVNDVASFAAQPYPPPEIAKLWLPSGGARGLSAQGFSGGNYFSGFSGLNGFSGGNGFGHSAEGYATAPAPAPVKIVRIVQEEGGHMSHESYSHSGGYAPAAATAPVKIIRIIQQEGGYSGGGNSAGWAAPQLGAGWQ